MARRTRKPCLLAAVATLTCAALAVACHAAGMWQLGVMWSSAALVWSWNL